MYVEGEKKWYEKQKTGKVRMHIYEKITLLL